MDARTKKRSKSDIRKMDRKAGKARDLLHKFTKSRLRNQTQTKGIPTVKKYETK